MISEKVVSKSRKLLRSVVTVLFVMVTLASCDSFSKQARLEKMESYSNNPGKTPEKVIEEIRNLEADYNKLSDGKKKNEAYNKITQWYKILGMRYLTQIKTANGQIEAVKNQYGGDESVQSIKLMKLLPDYEDAYEAFVTAANREAEAFELKINKKENSSNFWRLAGYCSLGAGGIIDEYGVRGKDSRQYFANGINCYKKAIDKDPKNVSALKELGTFYAVNLKDGEKAIPLLESAVSISTQDVDAMMTLGQAYYLARYSLPYNLEKDTRDYHQRANDIYDKIIKITETKSSNTSTADGKKLYASVKSLAEENKAFFNQNYPSK